MNATDPLHKTSPDVFKRILWFCFIAIGLGVGCMVLSFVLSCRRHKGAEDFPPGQLVRHRMDGRMGIVVDNSHALRIRFSCNYTSAGNFEVFDCEPFELVKLTDDDEQNLFWRLRERPTRSPDQTELP
jgi:hypothetical protein